MSERVSAASNDPTTTTTKTNKNTTSNNKLLKMTIIKTLIESIKILHTNKPSFLPILIFLSLPLSLLLHSLSLSSLPLETHSLSLLSLSFLVPTRSEHRQLWRESRDVSLSLLRLKLLYFLPIFSLSLLTTLSSVSLTHSLYMKIPFSSLTPFASVKSTCLPPFITSIYCYIFMLLYSLLVNVLSGLVFTSPGLSLLVQVVGFGLEVYVMGVMGVGMVGSVVEKRAGFGALRFGWNVMEGRRVSGWAVSGLLAGITGWVGWRMEGWILVVDAGDLSEFDAVVVARWWERWGLVALYGAVVVWGCVVFTVFYCECRKRHVVVREVELDEERALTSVDT